MHPDHGAHPDARSRVHLGAHPRVRARGTSGSPSMLPRCTRACGVGAPWRAHRTLTRSMRSARPVHDLECTLVCTPVHDLECTLVRCPLRTQRPECVLGCTLAVSVHLGARTAAPSSSWCAPPCLHNNSGTHCAPIACSGCLEFIAACVVPRCGACVRGGGVHPDARPRVHLGAHPRACTTRQARPPCAP